MNVEQAVPFFRVTDIEASVRWYAALGFEMKIRWAPKGSLRWCWLQNGGAALMLQDFRRDDGSEVRPSETLGAGVSVCFICKDALEVYRDATAKGLSPSRPFVGNNMWVTSLRDPDGYVIDFESPTDVPEETEYDAGASNT